MLDSLASNVNGFLRRETACSIQLKGVFGKEVMLLTFEIPES
jgi:hypothetical protein